MRVVSLVPSVTETLLAWQVPVVACTRFCEQPSLPHVGGTKDPDIGAIVALAPDVVVLDKEENRREDAQALTDAGLSLHVTHVVHVDHVAPMLRQLADAVDAPAVDPHQSGAGRSTTVEHGIDASAFVLIWRRPTMSINAQTYASSLLARLGITNVVGDHDDTYPTVEPSDVARLRPDLVLLPSEPYPFADRHLAEYRRVFPTSRVVLVDGRDLFWWGANDPGDRTPQGSPARGDDTVVTCTRPLRSLRHRSGCDDAEVNMNNVVPCGPPNMHAKQGSPVSITSST
jgi:ABC-type Fe3+-hydroxamate transport system substrate-binding protein